MKMQKSSLEAKTSYYVGGSLPEVKKGAKGHDVECDWWKTEIKAVTKKIN